MFFCFILYYLPLHGEAFEVITGATRVGLVRFELGQFSVFEPIVGLTPQNIARKSKPSRKSVPDGSQMNAPKSKPC